MMPVLWCSRSTPSAYCSITIAKTLRMEKICMDVAIQIASTTGTDVMVSTLTQIVASIVQVRAEVSTAVNIKPRFVEVVSRQQIVETGFATTTTSCVSTVQTRSLKTPTTFSAKNALLHVLTATRNVTRKLTNVKVVVIDRFCLCKGHTDRLDRSFTVHPQSQASCQSAPKSLFVMHNFARRPTYLAQCPLSTWHHPLMRVRKDTQKLLDSAGSSGNMMLWIFLSVNSSADITRHWTPFHKKMWFVPNMSTTYLSKKNALMTRCIYLVGTVFEYVTWVTHLPERYDIANCG